MRMVSRSPMAVVYAAACLVVSGSSGAEEYDLQLYKEQNTLKRVEVNGEDRGDHAYAKTTVERTKYSANKNDPHCRYSSGILGIGPYRGSNCAHLCVAMPSGKTPNLERIELLAGNSEQMSACPASAPECSIGWSKWYDVPRIESPSGRVCGKFKNWSDAYDRTIAMKIYYK